MRYYETTFATREITDIVHITLFNLQAAMRCWVVVTDTLMSLMTDTGSNVILGGSD